MSKIFKLAVLGVTLLILVISNCGKDKSTQPKPPSITLNSLNPTQGAPGTLVKGSTDLDSVGIEAVHIRIGGLDVPIISGSGHDFSFMVPILPPGSTQVTLRDTTGRESNALAFKIIATPPTGLPPGQIVSECNEVVEELLPVLQTFAAVLETTGYITPAETLSIMQDLQRISKILNAAKQEISVLPDSEKIVIDGILKQSGLAEIFGVTGSGGLKKSVKDLRRLLQTEDEYGVFYALVLADNLSFVLSAIKAQLTLASFALVLSGFGSGAGLVLTAVNICISTVDAMFDGFWPTDLYKMDVRFVPNSGTTLEVGETATGDFQGYFKTQSNPASASIGVITEGTLSAVSLAIPKTTIQEIASKIAIKAGVSFSQALITTSPLDWPGTVPVDMRYYSNSCNDILSLYLAPLMGPGFTVAVLLQILEAAGVEVFPGSANSVQFNTNRASYDISSNTLTAKIQGTIDKSLITMRAWAMDKVCSGEQNWWWTWMCLGIEVPKFLDKTAFNIKSITIYPAPDVTPPASITNLVASSPTSTSITLSWTAPGDDGNSGIASLYDIRYSTSTITESNWGSATQCSGEPTPKWAGSPEYFVVTGLSSNTKYYFAIKTADEVPNWSGLSNVASDSTKPPADNTPPAAITNLATSNPTSSSITLTWTAPGDDGNTGTASQYDIRYSTSTITSANWSSATQCVGEPAPKVASSSESFVVTGLSPNTTYYFAIKTADEVPNWSLLSNVTSGTTSAACTPANLDSNTIALWHMDEGTGSTVYDESKNHNTGKLEGDVTWTANDACGTALFFGGGGKIVIPDNNTLDSLYSISIEAWFYPVDINQGGIIAKKSAWDNKGYTVEYIGYNDNTFLKYRINFILRGLGFPNAVVNLVSVPLQQDKWHYIQCSYNGSLLQVSVDGLSRSYETSQSFSPLWPNDEPMIIGDGIKGRLDEVKISTFTDTTAPTAITSLVASEPTQNSIKLTWTGPGDDGNTGTASQYDIRYATSAITNASWNSATQCTGEPTPKSAGNSESFVVTGLSSNTKYYFAIKTADEVPNWSALSNVASDTTRSFSGSIEFVGHYYTPGKAEHVFVSGNYAYVADGDSGLQIINIGNPSNPSLAGSYNTPGYAYDVFVLGNYAYVADGDSGLQIINISNPSNPTLAGSYDTSDWDWASGVFVSGNYAYVAEGSPGLQIINISNPSKPTLVASYGKYYSFDVFVSGDYAYSADGGGALVVLNVSNPSLPTLAGFCPNLSFATAVFVLGNYAYVADQDALRIINVTDPTKPILVGSYDTLDIPVDVFVSGNYAYVADWTHLSWGLHIINISNPSNPTLAARWYLGDAWGVFVSGGYIYMARLDYGLTILRFVP